LAWLSSAGNGLIQRVHLVGADEDPNVGLEGAGFREESIAKLLARSGE